MTRARDEVVEPGDRYVSNDGRSLGIAPYKHVFHTGCKGRWIGLPLLTAFTCEFATVHSNDNEDDVVESPDDHSGPKRCREGDQTVSVSLDKHQNMLQYVEKLASGSLWVKNREAECLKAGRQYQSTIEMWMKTALPDEEMPGDGERVRLPPADFSLRLSSSSDGAVITQWDDLLRRSANDIHVLLSALPVLIVLRQIDTIHHANTRHEGWIPFDQPITILYADFRPPPEVVASRSSLAGDGVSVEMQPSQVERTTRNKNGATKPVKKVKDIPIFGGVPRLLFVEKPFGMPVHPSGKFRKNSITRILEDVMGGDDKHLYEAVLDTSDCTVAAGDFSCGCLVDDCGAGAEALSIPSCTRSDRSVLIRHKVRKFTLIVLSPALSCCSVAKLLDMMSMSAVSKEVRCLSTFVTHRLDVGTGGILMFGLDSTSARRATQLLAQKSHYGNEIGNLLTSVGGPTSVPDWERGLDGTEKRYIARVKGNMDTTISSSCPPSNGRLMFHGSWSLLSWPIYCASFFHSFYACPNDADIGEVLAYLKILQSQFDRQRHTNGGDMLLQAELQRERMDNSTTTGDREAKREAMRRCAQSKRPIERQLTSARPTSETGEALESRFCQVKSAVSAFRTVRFDSERNETIVECIPLTGRTHQLRVHLAFLGHPIANDLKYVKHSVVDPDVKTLLEDAQRPSDEQENGGIYLHALSYKLRFRDVIELQPDVVEVVSTAPSWASY